MKLSEIQKEILDTHSALLIRPRKEAREKGQPIHYDTKPLFTGNKRGWVMLDVTTANALQTCFNALSSPEARAKWDRVPITTLVDFAWEHVE